MSMTGDAPLAVLQVLRADLGHQPSFAQSWRPGPIALATFTLAKAVSAASWFALPRIRWPFSSNSGIRFFVPGAV